MIEGWKCPGCGACFAPFVKKCDTCIGNTVNNYTQPIPLPPCQHIWGALQTNGTFCTLCGVQQIPPPPSTTTCRAVFKEGQHDWLGSSDGDYCIDCGVTEYEVPCLGCGAPPNWKDHPSNCKVKGHR